MSALRALFHDRADAGKRLAEDLGQYRGRGDVVVLGLPRGGIPVAYEVAKALGAPPAIPSGLDRRSDRGKPELLV